jgi:hypothetical protein
MTITFTSVDTGLADVNMLILDPNTGSTFLDPLTVTNGPITITSGNLVLSSGSVTGATDIGTVTVTTTGKVTVGTECEIDGDLNHDGTNVGLYGVAPVARAAAYTQTYATATRTHAAPTAAAITPTYTTDDPSITPDGAVTIADGDTPTVNELLEFCVELNDQIGKLVTDLANAKQMINSLVDDSQAIGIAQ